MERVVRSQSKPQRSIRTDDATGLSSAKSIRSGNTGRRRQVIGHRREADSGKHVDDWCNRPVIQDRLGRITHACEIGVVNNTSDELVTAVKRRETIFIACIEWIEEGREAWSEGRRTLRS